MRSIIKVAIRVLIIIGAMSILAGIISTVSSWIYFPSTLQKDYIGRLLVPTLVEIVVVATIFYVLWRKTDWLVKLTAGAIDDNPLVINTSNTELLNVALRILGIFLVVTAIPNLFALTGYHFQNVSYYSGFGTAIPPETQANEVKEIIDIGVRLLIGVFLVLGTRGILKVGYNVRGFIFGDNDDTKNTKPLA